MCQIQDDDRKVLSNFFAGYFHQDWDIEAETPAGIVELYMRVAKIDEIDRLTRAIQCLIDDDSDNATLEYNLYREFGCYYMPSGDGLTAKEWLRSFVAVLSTKLGKNC